jgi:putative FmdB family regulatory protein
MPTYEYKCDACGHAFEKFQSITAPSVKKCPECGKSKVRRLISAGAGLIFKGDGFYITDYRSEGYKNSAKADNNGGAPETTKSESTGDSKPAESKTNAKSDSQSAVKGESKSDSKPAAAPAPKVESKPPSKPESKPQASKSARKS